MRSIALLLALAVPPLVATTASAGPIRVTYQRWGGDGRVSTLLPDDFATTGFELAIFSDRIPHTYPRPAPGTWPTPYTERTQTISGSLIFDREPLGSDVFSPDSPLINLWVDVTGKIWDSGVGGLWGTMEGSTNNSWGVSLHNLNDSTPGWPLGPDDYERWARDLGISRDYLEYLTTPGTVKISASVTDGYQNRLPFVLAVGPMPIPAPVPEPASWAAWGLAVAGAWAWRRRRAA